MEKIYGKAKLKLIVLFALMITASSCLPIVESEVVIYSNDFSDLNLVGFENGKLFIFQNDTISGFYHNDRVSLTLPNLPSHNYIKVYVDLLIHDSWDGNPDDGVSGPDYWYMGYDNTEVFRTTFSNSPCVSTFCLYQSFPNDYFRQNVPKSGATKTNIPGLCLFGAFQNYTTRYTITKLIPHTSSTIKIYMGGDLLALSSPDPVCDESWSIANIKIEAVTAD